MLNAHRRYTRRLGSLRLSVLDTVKRTFPSLYTVFLRSAFFSFMYFWDSGLSLFSSPYCAKGDNTFVYICISRQMFLSKILCFGQIGFSSHWFNETGSDCFLWSGELGSWVAVWVSSVVNSSALPRSTVSLEQLEESSQSSSLVQFPQFCLSSIEIE